MVTTVRASASVVVNHAIDDVFAFVSDVENMAEWVTGVSDPRLTADGEVGIGTTAASEYSYGGGTYDIEYEVTAYEPPADGVARFGIESTDGPFPFDGLLELESVDDGTRVVNTIAAGSDGRATAVIFVLFRPIMRWRMRRRLAGELDELRDALEDAADQPVTPAA